MSCIARAGWLSGMLSAVKLYQSSSISGPVATLFQLGFFHRRLPCRKRVGNRLAEALDSRRLRLALFRCHRAERLHQRRDAALLAEVFDAQRLERRQVVGSGDPPAGLALKSIEIVHRRAC